MAQKDSDPLGGGTWKQDWSQEWSSRSNILTMAGNQVIFQQVTENNPISSHVTAAAWKLPAGFPPLEIRDKKSAALLAAGSEPVQGCCALEAPSQAPMYAGWSIVSIGPTPVHLGWLKTAHLVWIIYLCELCTRCHYRQPSGREHKLDPWKVLFNKPRKLEESAVWEHCVNNEYGVKNSV